MNYKNISVLYCLTFILFISCKKENSGNNTQCTIIEATQLSDKNYDTILSETIDSIGFLPLKENEESFFAAISKIKIAKDTIYIFDRFGKNSVIAFDKDGNFITTFGEHGNGAHEYIRLWDFDVDCNYVYLYDRSKQKMLYFTHTGTFVKENYTSFRGEAFKILKNGCMLFSLEKEENSAKLCMTDSLLKIQKVLSNYQEDELNDKITDNVFQECDNTIFYNKAVNDSVYAFSADGKPLTCYYFNLNNQNVPDPLKYSYNKLLEENGKKKYTYFYNCPIFFQGKFMGTVFHNGNKSTFLYDSYKKIGGIKEWKKGIQLSDIILPLYINSKFIASWMDYSVYEIISDKDKVPSDVIEHMENGGRVIVFHYLKKTTI